MKLRIITLGLALVVTPIGLGTLTGCAGDRYSRSTGEYIDDKALTSRVKGVLGDADGYDFSGVNVSAYRGTVQLSGFVNTDKAKDKAEEIARTAKGVQEIENNITLKPSGT